MPSSANAVFGQSRRLSLRGPRQNGARACPPEDCGGGDGSHHLLESILDDEQDS